MKLLTTTWVQDLWPYRLHNLPSPMQLPFATSGIWYALDPIFLGDSRNYPTQDLGLRQALACWSLACKFCLGPVFFFTGLATLRENFGQYLIFLLQIFIIWGIGPSIACSLKGTILGLNDTRTMCDRLGHNCKYVWTVRYVCWWSYLNISYLCEVWICKQIRTISLKGLLSLK